MSYRDDFNSSMSSPGNYSSSSKYGSSGYSGNYGGTNNPGMGYQTPAQANFAAHGGSFGPGGGFGSLSGGGIGGLLGSLFGQQPPPGVPLGPVQGPLPPTPVPQGVPTPRRAPPPTTQEDVPYTGALPGGTWYPKDFTNAMNFRDAYSPTLSRPWGQYQTRPGTYPGQYTNANAPVGGSNNINPPSWSPSSQYPGANGTLNDPWQNSPWANSTNKPGLGG